MGLSLRTGLTLLSRPDDTKSRPAYTAALREEASWSADAWVQKMACRGSGRGDVLYAARAERPCLDSCHPP